MIEFLIRSSLRTGIVCTLGPASDDIDTLKRMLGADMTIARLNFSHGSHEAHQSRLDMLLAAASSMGKEVRVLMDLEGFRIRLGHLEQALPVNKGERVILTNAEPESADQLFFDYTGDLSVIRRGALVHIDDGKIRLSVESSQPNELVTTVVVGGVLQSRKGINIPELDISASGVTERDVADLAFARTHGVDYIAQSFVRNAKDIHTLRECMGESLNACKIVAKVECEAAVQNIDEIIEAADAIMIARGDMGVVMPICQVPFIQKEIICKCRAKGVPVITATQMLESMTKDIIPTRAEVADIANAVLDGTDYVMLSAETASGKYPAEAVEKMSEVVRFSESYHEASQYLILGNA